MNNVKPLSIAVWGLGGHAWKNILPAINSSTAVTLTGICTRDLENATQATNQFGGKVFATPQIMLSDEAVDAVYLATPTGLHFEHGMMVLTANKHLLCEKSLTHCAEQSLQLIDYANKKELTLLETFMYLYHPQFLTALDIINQPTFGKIVNIASNFGIPELPKSSFRMSKELGGSAFLDVGCYPISAVLHLVQEKPKILQFTNNQIQNDGIDISGTTTLAFPSDITAFLSWGYERAYRADLMIWGEKQSIYLDRAFSKSEDFEAKILLYDKYGVPISIPTKPTNSFVKMLDFFQQTVFNVEARRKLTDITKKQAKIMGLFQTKECITYEE